MERGVRARVRIMVRVGSQGEVGDEGVEGGGVRARVRMMVWAIGLRVEGACVYMNNTAVYT